VSGVIPSNPASKYIIKQPGDMTATEAYNLAVEKTNLGDNYLSGGIAAPTGHKEIVTMVNGKAQLKDK